MAIRDLIWRCAECGLEHGLRPRRRGEVCAGCGTMYRRAAGASITALAPGKTPLTLSSQEWLDRLETPGGDASPEPAGELSWLGDLRLFEGEEAVRNGDLFLGYR